MKSHLSSQWCSYEEREINLQYNFGFLFFVSSHYYCRPLVLKFRAYKLIFIIDISNNTLFFNLHNKRCVVYNIIFHLSKVYSDNQSCASCFDQDFDQREEGHASETANTHD